jgi:predicted pyridoxine 5'-phosphate oxidase superfamily flavin-nucleotide-binding protein
MATISTETHLREDLGSPSDLIVAKVTDHLTPLTRQFVERSPFVCVATSRPDGGLDISPRDDPAGFVRILDDPELLAPSTFDGRAPKLGLVVTIDEAFTHCQKAFIRSDLWNPDRHVDRSELPTSGAILREVADAGLDAETYDRERDARYARREGLY